jgi:hypothetical protein
MRGLVRRCFPNQQSAAKEIADFWHPTGDCGDDFETADLSRKMNGTRKWALEDAIALEAISGSTRISDAMHRIAHGVETEAHPDPISVLAHASKLIKEGGEGATALMALAEGGCVDKARAEVIDIIEAAQAVLDTLDGDD